MPHKDTAARALASLDLTDLNDHCDHAAVTALAAKARTPHGPVAALCIWPRFLGTARAALGADGPKLACVVNFPHGDHARAEVNALTNRAIEDGADEIDMVIPWQALIGGDRDAVRTRVRDVVDAACGRPVKAILESGMLPDPALIDSASRLALEGGAAFLKTSTGFVETGATVDAARIMLSAIKETGASAGFKASGGVRSLEDAALYLGLADEIMGAGWATPDTFRFGASSLLGVLLDTLDGQTPATPQGGGY